MGQTLTYGVYLPDEGERNCYSGLAQNWQILDNAVGAIADKASASHTHGNITNAGAIGSTSGLPIITGTDGVLTTSTFGSTAGTFCEGNDSRLSDARTPVYHTHGKADITDLFNSANTWTGANTFTSPFVMQQYSSSNTHGYVIKASFARGDAPSASTNLTFRWQDSNGVILGFLDYIATSSMYAATLNVRTETDGSQISDSVRLETDLTGSYFAFNPASTGNIDLGNSSHKWKTFNGINPGALSLPDYASFTDISGNITNLDGTDNFYTPAVNGWISICVAQNSPTLGMYCDRNNSWGASFAPTSNNGPVFGMLPLVAGNRVRIRTVCGAVIYARFYPCLGNV